VVVDPHALTRHGDAPTRALVAFTITVAERPWAVSGADRTALRAAGLDDAAILHALLQAALFGHHNRIADAVGVDADYPDRFAAPRPEAATPAYHPAPLSELAAATGHAAAPITLALREGISDRLAGWLAHVLDRDDHLDRRRRALVRATVATWLGDARPLAAVTPSDDLDRALVALTELVVLAPWRLGPAAYADVRTLGLADDAAVFAAVATASTCALDSRIHAVLDRLARPGR